MRSTHELVEAAKLGDPSAFSELVGRYQRAAVTTAWAITGDFHQAQDVAQDCFVSAFHRLGTLRVSKAFGPWLLVSVRRAALRSRDLHAKRVGKTIEDVAAKEPHWLEQFSDVLVLMNRLPEHEQEVLRLRYLSDLPVDEIAEITARPVGTVTKQISRAIARLRSLFLEPQS
jgi:RNA polymerase sigma-70 factor (ECF subfamily)